MGKRTFLPRTLVEAGYRGIFVSIVAFISQQSYGINYPGYAYCFAEKMVGKVVLKMVDFFFSSAKHRRKNINIFIYNFFLSHFQQNLDKNIEFLINIYWSTFILIS